MEENSAASNIPDSQTAPPSASVLAPQEPQLKPQPFVKWAGGKRQLLPELRKRLPNSYSNYFEPFVGGGALFFDRAPSSAVLNDCNHELINAYRVIKTQVDELIEDLAQHTYNSGYYYSVRNMDRTSEYSQWSAVAKASRFLFLNKTCFNGLYRVNQKGQFNTPFGKYKNPRILDEANLRACSAALTNVDLRCSSFLDLEDDIKEGDFVYCDPPYLPISDTSNFTSYQAEDFDLDMHIELRNFCRRISEKGAKFLLSNSSAKVVPDLYKGFKIKKVLANRAINSKAANRGEIEELLISNY